MTARRNLKPLVRARLWTLFTIALFALAIASSSTLLDFTRAATTWEVQMKGNAMTGFSFDPNTISVSVGDTVNWTDMAAGEHTVVSLPDQAESWDSGTMSYGQFYLHTFNIPGTYVYHSTLESNMAGEVVVTEAIPEFPGLLVFVTLGLAIFVGLALERTLRRSP
jgi:plastocyanin